MDNLFCLNYYSWKRICILYVFLFLSNGLNAQDNAYQKKYDSIYVSKGINKIAEYVYKNGWINFNPNAKLKAEEVFEKHKELFGLKEEDEMVLKAIVSDNLGFKHYRYYQKHNGIKVEFSDVILHENVGILQKSSGTLIPDLKLETKPLISENDAYKYVIQFLITKFNTVSNDVFNSLKKIESELVILPKDIKLGIYEDCLSYKFNVYNEKPLYGATLYVDAQTGSIILEDSNIKNIDAIGSASTLYSGTQSIITDFSGGTYRLRDYSRDATILTYNMNGCLDFSYAADFIDVDNNWTPADAGQDVHWGIEKVYEYYRNFYGRNSYDNDGATIKSYVHTDLRLTYRIPNANALWDGTMHRIVFGDGYESECGPLVSIDYVGHEFTHAITDYSANLIYSNEPGALDESFSDIFGTAIEFYAKPSNANWLIGDEFSISGISLRNMSNPKDDDNNGYDNDGFAPQPDTYLGVNWYYGSGDNGGVHFNSGVQNYWFYLLSQGGSGTNDNGDNYNVTGIGIVNAAAIAYRNLTIYLTQNSGYKDARQGSIEAAIDLFGKCSNEVTQVINAWNAVGVNGETSTDINIYVCGNVPDGKIYIASNNIYAGNYCDNGSTTINSGSTVVFRAGNTIRLNPGFQAQQGCTFIASVLNCGNGVLYNSSVPDNTIYIETQNANDLEQNREDNNKLEDESSNKIDNEFDIVIMYPNPTTGNIDIKLNKVRDNPVSIAIYDDSGTMVLNFIKQTPSFSIDLSDINSGVYYIRISDGVKVITKQIIKIGTN